MKCHNFLAAIFVTTSFASFGQPLPLSISVADHRYLRVIGGGSVAGTTTFLNLTVSGTCTGCTTGAVPTTRLISTTAPLAGGGDLSADRTLTCTLCLTSGGALGTPSSGTGTNLTGIPESGITSLVTDLAAKLAASANLSDLANAGTARTNLGLGTLATQSGTFSGASSGTNTGDQTITLTSDVTGSGTGSFATTIAAGAVTLTKQANMATASVVYRKTAGSGAPEVNTLATLKTDLGLTGTNSGDQTSVSGNAGTASASDHTPTACGANMFAQSQSTVWAFTCAALTLAAFPTIATNTVLVNATSGTAVPTAQAVSTCSAAGSALNWTTNTGFGCNTSITANSATTATNATNTAITDDTTTSATMYPTWVTTASGNQAQKTSSTLLTFNPSAANFGIGGSPSATSGIRLLVQMNGNQVTKISSSNPDSTDTGAAANVNAAADVSVAQLSAFGSAYSGTLAGLNLAGSASVNNGGGGTVGFTVGSTSAAPVVLMTNATRAATISASSQTVSLRGTQTNDNATAGDSGEYQTATVAANTTSLSTGTSVNVGTNTNITLTAGDWDCSGVVNFTFGATTSITNLTGGISTTTGTLPAQDSYFDYETAAMVPTGTAVATWVVPTVRLSNSGSTNIFLVAQGTFTLSTVKVGGTIRCRRMR